MPIIDRFEGDWAIVEHNDQTFNFPRSLLPEGAAEGDVLTFTILIDSKQTAARQKRIKALEDELFR